MKRIDTPTRAVDLFGAGKDGFADGNPVSGVPATTLNASWFNALQEELCTVIEGAGLTLDPNSYSQLLLAIQTLVLFYMPVASETVQGKVELATSAETQAGSDTARAVTPAALASRTATDTRSGLVELATSAETQAGADAARAVTPAGLASRTATETRAGLVELATVAEALAGADTTRAVTPAGLASAKSLATNGYMKLPGGLIIQWGLGTVPASGVNSSNVAVTFPLAFPAACFAVVGSPRGLANSSSGGTPAFRGASPTVASFTAGLDTLSAVTFNQTCQFNWLAIGY